MRVNEELWREFSSRVLNADINKCIPNNETEYVNLESSQDLQTHIYQDASLFPIVNYTNLKL